MDIYQQISLFILISVSSANKNSEYFKVTPKQLKFSPQKAIKAIFHKMWLSSGFVDTDQTFICVGYWRKYGLRSLIQINGK